MDGPSASARVDHLVRRALSLAASDIHMDPWQKGIVVRFRVDGRLIFGEQYADEHALSVVLRMKLLAGMDIAERRVPQDGSFEMAVEGEDIDFRVSTLPTIHGEKVVVRLLRGGLALRDIRSLGMDDVGFGRMQRMLRVPFGMILTTGPTGSGKTTTLYALLQSLYDPSVNVVCLEDPVEYRIPGFHQVEINTRTGLTFSAGLRSILRQDPNVIMVGEIRDRETAEIAVRAALTGHRVLSSLHTGSAVGGLVRLMDMGIEPYLVASAITGVIGQRLLQRRCPSCDSEDACAECQVQVSVGRLAVFEVMLMDDALRRQVLLGAPVQTLMEAAIAGGMRTLSEGITSLSERGAIHPEEHVRWCSEEYHAP